MVTPVLTSIPATVVENVTGPVDEPVNVQVKSADAPPGSATGIPGQGPATRVSPPPPSCTSGRTAATSAAAAVPEFVTVRLTIVRSPRHRTDAVAAIEASSATGAWMATGFETLRPPEIARPEVSSQPETVVENVTAPGNVAV